MTPQERLAAALDVDFGDCWIDEAQPDGSTISTSICYHAHPLVIA